MTSAAVSIAPTALRVLLCDDQEVLRVAIKMVLSKLPRYQVAGEAFDGVSCLKEVAELQPDIVILDVHMPGGGADLVHQLRLRHADLHIVMFSGRAESSVQQAMLTAGADRYVVKTGRLAELLAALEPRSVPKPSRFVPGGPGSSPPVVGPESGRSAGPAGPALALPAQEHRLVLLDSDQRLMPDLTR